VDVIEHEVIIDEDEHNEGINDSLDNNFYQNHFKKGIKLPEPKSR